MSFLPIVKLWLWISALATVAGWLLSAIHQLNLVGYLVLAALAMVAVLVARRFSPPPAFARRPRQGRRFGVSGFRSRFRRALPLSFAILATLIFLGGVLYAPNNHTGLSYRLPRVLHWLAEGRWHWIHTPNYRMNDRACGIEWMSAPLMLLTRSDRLLFLLNFIPYLMLPGLIFSVWTRMGVRPRVAWHWMWLLPTGYIFLLQAGSAGNDTFPSVYALAAMDFAFRARESRRFSDLAYSVIAAALLTGAKASNIPLLLPWGILIAVLFAEHEPRFRSFVRGVLELVKNHPIGVPALALVAGLVSLLPTAVLNQHYMHDWSGLSIERPGMDMKNPIVGLWGNALILLFNNFLFTFFPFARWWNAHVLNFLPPAIVSPLVSNFEGGFHIVGEMPTEDYAGVGFGVSMLALVSMLAAFLRREKSRENKGGYGLLHWMILVAPWVALAGYCMKSGMVTGARLIAPYYPLIFPLLLVGRAQSEIVRKGWWRVCAWLVILLALAVLLVSPARPLWPAQSVLGRAVERHPNNSYLSRALAVYTVYGQRSDPLAHVRKLLPPDVTTVGFMGTEDDLEISFWRPYFKRRVEDVLITDSVEYMRDRNVQYVLVGGLNFVLHQSSLDEWLPGTGGKVIATTSATLKVMEGPQPWYVVRID